MARKAPVKSRAPSGFDPNIYGYCDLNDTNWHTIYDGRQTGTPAKVRTYRVATEAGGTGAAIKINSVAYDPPLHPGYCIDVTGFLIEIKRDGRPAKVWYRHISD